jgi:hypothetical protein
VKAPFEVAHVLSAQWTAIELSAKNNSINSWQLRTLSAIKKCRTAELGGHVDGCSSCGKLRISFNSCRNRHCPKCQGKQREEWVQARQNDLLPVSYFHVVFTLPGEFNGLCMAFPRILYGSLFDAAWDSIRTFSNDENHLGATTGMIAVLHTWGQQLNLHPHLHCIIPAGGLTRNRVWKNCKTRGNYLFPVKALSAVFRAKYMHHLRKRITDHNVAAEQKIALPDSITNTCFKKPWVVHAKKPFSGVNSVLEYLGRYSHKIAISNHRISGFDKKNNTVSFRYKDYKIKGKRKFLTLSSMEFIRRFSLHILPKSFVRIRHYGILSSTSKEKAMVCIRKQLPAMKHAKPLALAKPFNPHFCSCCKKETMLRLMDFDHRGPPGDWMNSAKQSLLMIKLNSPAAV